MTSPKSALEELAREADALTCVPSSAWIAGERIAAHALIRKQQAAILDLQRRLGEAEREREAYAELQSRCFDGGGSQSVFDALKEARAANRALVEALGKFGRHQWGCRFTEPGNYKCTCGLTEALRAAQLEKGNG